MDKNLKTSKFILMILVTMIALCDSGEMDRSGDEYVDSVVNMLLNGDSFQNVQEDEIGDQPMFSEGLWKCGSCDVINEEKLIYSEVYDVDNEFEEEPFQVQVGIAIDGTNCVTITADADSAVRLVSGSCAGAHATFNVDHAPHFTVYVYSL